VLTWEEWLKAYRPQNALPDKVVADVLSTIADPLAIRPTQIYPSDRFDTDLCPCDTWCIVLDDPNGGMEMALESIRTRYSIPTGLIVSPGKIGTVGELIQLVQEFYPPTGIEGQNGRTEKGVCAKQPGKGGCE